MPALLKNLELLWLLDGSVQHFGVLCADQFIMTRVQD
jgi:hypothetical protein